MNSLALFYAILFISLALIGKWRYVNYANPTTLFCGLWALILFLYSFRLFDLYEASDLTMTVILVGVVAFFVGSFFCSPVFPTRHYCVQHRLRMEEFGELKLNYNVVLLLNIISITVLVVFAVVTVRLLLSGHNMGYIRYNYLDPEGPSIGGSGLSRYMMTFFILPWNHLIVPLSSIMFFLQMRVGNKKLDRKRKLVLFTCLADIALYLLVSASRLYIVIYLFYFYLLTILFSLKVKVHFSRRHKILLVLLFMLGYVAISIISKSRGSRPLHENAYLYVCGCIPLLSHSLNEFLTTPPIFTLGLASFRGFVMPILIPLSKLIGYPNLYLIAAENVHVLQDRSYIAPAVTYNAFVSPFYHFFIDGGVAGVTIFSFIFGFVAMVFYKRLIIKRNLSSLLLYCLFSYSIAFSMVRFQFTNMHYALSFFYVALCFWNVTYRVKFKWRR